MKKPNNKTQPAPIIVEPVDRDFLNSAMSANAAEYLTWTICSADIPQYELKKGDMVLLDAHIKPIIGGLAIYYIPKKETYVIERYFKPGRGRKTYKFMGMATHFLKPVYLTTDYILSAEYLDDEMPEKRIPSAYDFD